MECNLSKTYTAADAAYKNAAQIAREHGGRDGQLIAAKILEHGEGVVKLLKNIEEEIQGRLL